MTLIAAAAFIITFAPAGTTGLPAAPGVRRPTQSDFLVREWLVEDGLPYNAVNTLVRGERQFLWAGTPGGLARFDGRRIVAFEMPPAHTQHGFNIRSLAVEDAHSLLLINSDDTILRFTDGAFTLHPVSAHLRELPEDFGPREIAVAPDGALWIGTSGALVLRYAPDGTLERFGPESGITRRSGPFTFVNDAAGRIWVAGGEFLGWHDAAGMHRVPDIADRAIMITRARSGDGLWIAGRDRLERFIRGMWHTVLSGDDWPCGKNGIQVLFEGADGALWIATRHDGLFHLPADGKTLQHVPLRNKRVLAITDDPDGNLWLGLGGGGLARIKPRTHILLNSASGMPEDLYVSAAQTPDGALWCASESGQLVRYKDGRATIVDHLADQGQSGRDAADPVRLPHVNAVCADATGFLWAGAIDGLYSVNGNEFMRIDLPLKRVNALYPARNGDLWVAWNYNQAGVLRDGKLHECSPPGGFPSARVAGFAEDSSGGIWIGTAPGRIYRVEPETRRLVEKSIPPHANTFARLHTLHIDDHDRLWLGTSNGLLIWAGDRARLFTRHDRLPDDIINQIVDDGTGRLWLSSRRGIFCVDMAQFAADAPAPAKIRTMPVGRDEDLDSISSILGSQSMALAGRDGRIWFTTYRGLLGLDGSAQHAPRQPLPVYIESIAIDGDAPRGLPSGQVTIPPCPASLTFHYTALNFSTPERTRVQRMLEGHDTQWIEATGEDSCTYARLPPGHYRFRVRANDGPGGAPESETSLAIEIAAAWWQNRWFVVAAAALGAITFAALIWSASHRLLKHRLRRLRRRHSLELERTRIARDLHDELGGRLAKIKFIAERLRNQAADPAFQTTADRLYRQAGCLSADLRDIIWTVNPENDSWRNCAEYISRHAHSHLVDTGIHCIAEGIESMPAIPISPQIRHHLLAIAKETLNNMIKHAQADRIDIRFTTDGDHVHLRMADNGRGFDPAAAARNDDGNGLANMRARAAEIGACLDIASAPDSGTTTTLVIPLRQTIVSRASGRHSHADIRRHR